MLRHTHFTHMHSGGLAAGVVGTEDAALPKQIYADNAIPGEEALVEMLRRQRGFRQGVVRELVSPSPSRVVPFCPHSNICGGCNWQHIDYPTQLYWKQQILVDALSKYEIVTPLVPNVIPSPLQQGYRNKSEYAFSSLPEPVFGFHSKDDRSQVFACQTCSLQAPYVHRIAQKIFGLALEMQIPFYQYFDRSGLLKALQIRTTTLGETLCILIFSEEPAKESIHGFFTRLRQEAPTVTGWFYQFNQNCIHVGGAEKLTETIDELNFRYSPQSFFQPNPLQAAALYRQVKEYAALTGSETVYDLYTGIGSIACYVAKEAKQVFGIEGNATAIMDANDNAKLNNLNNTQFITGDILETYRPDFIDSHPQADVIILDPPRSGTLIEIKKVILYAAPQKIIYVSCNPVSLAWDLKQLCAGGYHVTAIQPFDMFPHTHHVETVCLLEH